MSMLGLVNFLWGHQFVSQAIEIVATFAQCTSHFSHSACFGMYLITTQSQHFSLSAIIYNPVPDCSFFYFQSKLSGPPWIASLGAERQQRDNRRDCVLFVRYLLILPRWKSDNFEFFIHLFPCSFQLPEDPDKTRQDQTRAGHTRPELDWTGSGQTCVL